MAGNCVAGFCEVPVPGAAAHPAAVDGKLDAYWREPPIVVVDSRRGDAVRDTMRESNAFNWDAFGIGVGVAFGSLLLLIMLGVAIVGFRLTRVGNGRSVETA
jgi:hypothetical protein